MCPYFIFSQIYGLCKCYYGGLMCPSIQEREEYCLREFKKCPYFQLYQTETNTANEFA